MPADWHLVPCLAKLRDEFNAIAPGRDKTSDGTIGDTAHQQSVSDHNPDETGAVPIRDADSSNEVHGLDVDVDLRTPGLTMEKIVQFTRARCLAGTEKRLRYIIFDRRIWSASNGWREEPYRGANPHDHHAHFSASYDSAREASTASWHLEDIPVALNETDKIDLRAIVRDELTAFGKRDPLATIYLRTGYVANTFAPAIAKAVAAIVPQDVDEDALAAALAAKLPADRDDVTADELQAAIVGAARELLGQSPPAGQ